MAPAVFTIPPRVAFVDALAAGLAARHAGDDPLALARVTVLLPTRRACRALAEAFLRQSAGRALLLPRLVPLGDLDDEPELDFPLGAEAAEVAPAIAPLRRQLLLARLVQQAQPVPADQAARLAQELARLIDQVHTERLDFGRLAELAPAEFARHWQVTLDFLRIVVEHWPAVLAEEGTIDPAARRNALLEARAAAWETAPPADPVIAAGSTGSIPATADLLRVVAMLPQGAVVLPGLDRDLDDASWDALGPTHPQYGLRQLLAGLGVDRVDVADWDDAPTEPEREDRVALLREAMRPAETAERWTELDAAPLLRGVRDMVRVDAPGEREEAGTIALMLRQALEGDGTAALVTPDRGLARRVAAALARWGIAIDDSGGTPLGDTPPGTFLRLVAQLAADPAPVPLLAALKHPLAAGGLAPPAFRARVRVLEIAVLRGPRPAPGLAGLRAVLDDPDLLRWLDDLDGRLAPLTALFDGRPRPLEALLDGHVAAAQALSTDDQGSARLWAGEAGEAAAAFVAELKAGAGALAPLPATQYPALLGALMSGATVRPRYGTHPRLAILGPLEARLQHVDLVVLGGLNEGTWPAEPAADPWMSRPMRAEFGLAPAERRVGLAAHDFVEAGAARSVVLTRAVRSGGAPTVPSRWLTRLDTVLRGAGEANGLPRERQWLDWLATLDRPDGPPQPWPPPAPRPQLEARPRKLSVTRVETWMRDPYAIYAQYVLRLRALDPLDAAPDAAAYGTIVHEALDAFVSAHPTGPLPDDALDRLLAAGRARFGNLAHPTVQAFWWPRFERIARWFVGHEGGRRAALDRAWAEVAGRLEIAAPGGPFTLTATADRIDEMAAGGLVIVDYKTGAPPSQKQVAAGFAPQLPLEAAIARAGGFDGIPAAAAQALLYWRLSGGEVAGHESAAGDDPAALCDEALIGLTALVARFDVPETPYEARPRPSEAPAYSDYEHLARVKEWAAASEDPT